MTTLHYRRMATLTIIATPIKTCAMGKPFYVINAWRACAARVTVVGLSVSLCVYAYSGTTGYEAGYEAAY